MFGMMLDATFPCGVHQKDVPVGVPTESFSGIDQEAPPSFE